MGEIILLMDGWHVATADGWWDGPYESLEAAQAVADAMIHGAEMAALNDPRNHP